MDRNIKYAPGETTWFDTVEPVFKVGDVVVLRSGEPALVVGEVRTDGCVNVVWVLDGHVMRDAFDLSEGVRVSHG